MNKKVISLVLIMILGTSILLQGCAPSGASSNEIKVVLAAPLTGNSAQWGESLKYGIGMAVDEINAKGGILGKTVKVAYEDDKGDPKEAVNVAQRIVTDKDVAAVIGHFMTSATMAASPVYQKVGLPEIAIASTNPLATSAGDYIFRVNVTNTHQGSGIVKWLVNKQNKKKLAIIYVNDDYGKGIVEMSKTTAKGLGAEVVFEGAVAASGEQDFTVLLTKAKAANPDALVIFSFYATGAQVLLQADKLGLDMLTVGSDAIYSPDLINIAGKSAEGVYVATWFHQDNEAPNTQKFIKSYKEKYKADSDTWAPYAYDAMYVLAQAIEKAGKVDRAAIRDALKQTKDFNGATGNITFNEDRVPDPSSKELLFTIVKDGKFELVK